MCNVDQRAGGRSQGAFGAGALTKYMWERVLTTKSDVMSNQKSSQIVVSGVDVRLPASNSLVVERFRGNGANRAHRA
jgi:hypothetical protein